MATVSFDRSFVVTDKDSISKIREDLDSPRKIKVKKRDYKAESARCIQKLRQKLPS